MTFNTLSGRCKTWTLDWTGLDWTGLDSLREYAHCERIGGPRFFSFFCGDRDKSILFVLHFVYFFVVVAFFCAHMDIIIISSESEDSDYDKAVPGANW